MEKEFEYAHKISAQIADMFNEDECSNSIDIEELANGNNLKCFIHALATIVPCLLFEKLTGQEKNSLEFNHLANMLVFEFLKKVE